MSDSIEVDGLVYGEHMIREMRINLEAARAESAELRAERDSFMQQAADMAARFAEVRAERDALRALVFKACSLGDDAAFMRKDCDAFMASFDEIRATARSGT